MDTKTVFTISLIFKIESEGIVSNAEVNLLKGKPSDGVRNCIKQELLKLKFPKPKGGRSVIIEQPVNFIPNGP